MKNFSFLLIFILAISFNLSCIGPVFARDNCKADSVIGATVCCGSNKSGNVFVQLNPIANVTNTTEFSLGSVQWGAGYNWWRQDTIIFQDFPYTRRCTLKGDDGWTNGLEEKLCTGYSGGRNYRDSPDRIIPIPLSSPDGVEVTRENYDSLIGDHGDGTKTFCWGYRCNSESGFLTQVVGGLTKCVSPSECNAGGGTASDGYCVIGTVNNNETNKTGDIPCAAGKYLPKGYTTCSAGCTSGSYCEGGSFSKSDTKDQGITPCPDKAKPYSKPGSASENACTAKPAEDTDKCNLVGTYGDGCDYSLQCKSSGTDSACVPIQTEKFGGRIPISEGVNRGVCAPCGDKQYPALVNCRWTCRDGKMATKAQMNNCWTCGNAADFKKCVETGDNSKCK